MSNPIEIIRYSCRCKYLLDGIRSLGGFALDSMVLSVVVLDDVVIDDVLPDVVVLDSVVLAGPEIDVGDLSGCHYCRMVGGWEVLVLLVPNTGAAYLVEEHTPGG